MLGFPTTLFFTNDVLGQRASQSVLPRYCHLNVKKLKDTSQIMPGHLCCSTCTGKDAPSCVGERLGLLDNDESDACKRSQKDQHGNSQDESGPGPKGNSFLVRMVILWELSDEQRSELQDFKQPGFRIECVHVNEISMVQ